MSDAPSSGIAGSVVVEFEKGVQGHDDENDEAAAPAANYRITGFCRWKTVIVPPVVYVVHTRRVQAEPLHLGSGVSFRYDPSLDAFLVSPAAVQTLLIDARCISAERRGVLVQERIASSTSATPPTPCGSLTSNSASRPRRTSRTRWRRCPSTPSPRTSSRSSRS